ncbi:MFS transporter [Planktotalea sp.]|uniref:MFS transporter n=1 Tax=Planktotalea sp. TaxID=2029877 RepID=UPI0032987309
MTHRSAWLAVAAMFVLNGALFGIWASRIPTVADRHELSSGNLGLLLLLMAAGAIVAFPFSGRWSDRFGAVRVTRVLAVLYALSLFLIAGSPSYWTLAVSLFLFGATHGGMDVSMNTWAGEAEKYIARPVMSSFHAMWSLGAGIGAGTGFLAARADVGIGLHFVLAGALVAVITLYIARVDWRSDTQARVQKGPFFVFPKGPLLAVGFFAFCASIGEGGMADWSAIFLIETTGASEANAALGYSIYSLAMVAMRLMGDRVTQRFGPVSTARFAGTIAAVGVLCAVGFGTYGMSLFGFVLMGIGYAVIIPLAFSRAANDPVMSPGAAIASVSTLGYGGILLGPPLIGFMAEATSIRSAFVVLAVLAVLIVVLAPAVRRTDNAG